MIIKEFGKKEGPVLLLIHGGGLGWWSLKKQIALLEKEYCIKAVVIDGHGEAYQQEFSSIEDTANQILDYIKSNQITSIHGICGLSIGAQIVVELLTLSPELSENWLIESALVIPFGKMNDWMMWMLPMVYPLVKKRWYAKLQAKTLCIADEDFEQYYEDSSKMSLNSLKAITMSNGSYALKQNSLSTSKNVWICVGGKEPKVMIKSANLLNQSIPNSHLEIFNGYKHGELSLKNPEQYVEIIRKFQS